MATAQTNPAIDILTRELATLDKQVALLAAELREAKASAQSVRNAIAHLSGGSPDSVAIAATHPRRGGLVGMVLAILEEVGSAGISPQEIADKLGAQGRETSKNTVASTLARMKQDGLASGRLRHWFKAGLEGNLGNDAQEENEPHSASTGGSETGKEGAPSPFNLLDQHTDIRAG